MWRRLKEKAEVAEQQKQEDVEEQQEEQLAVKIAEEEVEDEHTVADLVGCSQIQRWP